MRPPTRGCGKSYEPGFLWLTQTEAKHTLPLGCLGDDVSEMSRSGPWQVRKTKDCSYQKDIVHANINNGEW